MLALCSCNPRFSYSKSHAATFTPLALIDHVPWHPSISRTLPLPKPAVPPNASGSCQLPSTSTRVHCDLLPDNKAIGDEFADGLPRVGIGNFIDFVRVKPDFALSASCNGGGEPLLGPKVDPIQDI